MDFCFSTAPPRETYHDDDLAQGILLREHNDSLKEIAGSLRAQRDWNYYVSPVVNYHGGLGEKFSFVRVTIPECLPERLEIISYANEYAFLYDDQMEQLDLKNFREGRDSMLGVFDTNALDHSVTDETRPEKRLQAQMLVRMMTIDRNRATTAMQSWAKFVQLASRTRSKPFRTLREYLPSRVVDAGELFWYGMLTFAMALTIPAAHQDACFSLARSGYEAISLVNDLYSWPKERRDAELAGQDYVFNAIWVIMDERNCDEARAVLICKQEIKDCMEKLKSNVKAARELKMPKDIIIYLEAVQLSHVGNLVWSIYCPRYHDGWDASAP